MHAKRDAAPVYSRHQSGAISVDKMAAGILTVLIPVPSPISVSLSIGGALSLAVIPVTFPTLWRSTRGRWLLIATLALVPVGWLVAQTSVLQDHDRTFNTASFLYGAALPVGLLASLVGAYWCSRQLGLQRFLLLSSVGLLAAAFLTYNQTNPWKYGLALPISMLVLLLIARNRLLLGLVATPLLVAVSVAADYRSWIAVVGVATILGVFTGRSWKPLPTSRVVSLGLIAAAASTAIGWLITQASVAGMLGDYLKQRTDSQLATSSGNLLLGGRPEWGAAIGLFRESPLGIGIGVAPSYNDYAVAIRNMPISTALQENTNVATSFRAGVINFHSWFLNLWAVYSVAGVLFSILAIAFLIRATLVAVTRISQTNLRAAVALLILGSIWDILFSPTLVAQLAIALAAALHILGDPNADPIRTKDSHHERSTAHQRDHNRA